MNYLQEASTVNLHPVYFLACGITIFFFFVILNACTVETMLSGFCIHNQKVQMMFIRLCKLNFGRPTGHLIVFISANIMISVIGHTQ